MLLEDLAEVLSEETNDGGDDSKSPVNFSEKAGKTIIKAGEKGIFMFVLQSGEVEIRQGDELLEVVGPNGIVGEMALVDGSLRSATVTARSDVTLVPISKRRFQLLIRQYPDFGLYVMKVMSLRLRLMNDRLSTVMVDISTQKEVEEQLRQMANLDPLTGIFNRRHFHVTADHEIDRATRHERLLSAMMLDVDRFKSINDTYGHACGDDVIRLIVDAIGKELRTTDVFGRVGGEEFAVLLPETDLQSTVLIAERIRRRISDLRVERGGELSLTISIGASAWHPGETSIEHMMERADQGLYKAKKEGRNRVMTIADET